MFKKVNNELYIGVVVWLITILIAYGFWDLFGEYMIIAPSTQSRVAAAFLFCLYLAGFFLSHGMMKGKQRKRYKVYGLLISGVAIVVLSISLFYYAMIACMTIMVISQLPSCVNQKWAMAIAVTVPTVLAVIDHLLGKADVFSDASIFVTVAWMVTFSTVNVLALIASYRAVAERKAKLESENLVRELKATQLLLSATTKRDERLRISRNLHDIMGHQLTALSLQLEVAGHVEGDAKKEHIDNAKMIGTSMLANVRETVSEFREEKDLKLYDALSALIQGIPNLEIKLTVNWVESLANERQVEVLFRSSQEALTNVARHSDATLCDITVSSDEQNLTLVVRDNGGGSAVIIPGNGLIGMAERVSKIDGDLHFDQDADGFVLVVKLPISEL